MERASFDHQDALDWTRAALRKRHYRVRSVVEVKEEGDARKDVYGRGTLSGGQVTPGGYPGEVGEVTYLYANKNSWATLSTFVFHAALVTLFMSVPLKKNPMHWDSRAGLAKLVAAVSVLLWIGIIFAGRWIAYT